MYTENRIYTWGIYSYKSIIIGVYLFQLLSAVCERRGELIAEYMYICIHAQCVHENIIIIGDLSETHWRLIGDRHVWSETNWRPTCLIGDASETIMPDPIPTYLIRDPSESDILYQVCPMDLRWGMLVFDGSPMRHVGLRWGMLVSDRSPIRLVGFQWVSDGTPIGLRK